jgi:hypothetical protein
MLKKMLILIAFLLTLYLGSVVYRVNGIQVYERYQLTCKVHSCDGDKIQFKYPIYWNDDQVSMFIGSTDKSGVYLIDYNKTKNLSKPIGKQYYPVSIAIVSLRVIQDIDRALENKIFVKANLDWLVKNQDKKTGLWYSFFNHKFGDTYLKAPWPSGLAQGAAISALLRGAKLFNNKDYYDSAILAYQGMLLPILEGGVLYDADFGPIIEEYPSSSNPTHVLNGYLYTLIALSDLADNKVLGATEELNKHLTTLENILPEYSLPFGWSAYSLDRPTLRNHFLYSNPFYHKLHMKQLRFLCDKYNKKQICLSADKFDSFEKGIGFFAVASAYKVFQDLVFLIK